MAEPVLHLLDPHYRIRSASETLRQTEPREHSTAAGLVASLEEAASPALAVADLTSEPPDAATATFPARPEMQVLLLVATADEKTGKEWLDAGASDFVTLPAREQELDARVRRLLRLHEVLSTLEKERPWDEGFLRHLVHELNNPLNAIFGYCQLLLTDPATDVGNVREDLGNVVNNAQILLDVCQRLAGQESTPVVRELSEEVS
jgi:DNA-binding response OmpR family regulator